LFSGGVEKEDGRNALEKTPCSRKTGEI